MQTGPGMHQTDEAPAVEFSCRVRALRLGEGERRGNGLSISDHKLGTIAEHGRVQRTHGCDTTPRLGENQTRLLQALIRAGLQTRGRLCKMRTC